MKKGINTIKISIISVLLAGLFLFSGFKSFSQTKADSRTYQFLFFTEDARDAFFQGTNVITDSLLMKIEQLRHPEKVVYAKISAGTIVKIMPQNSVVNGFFYSEKTFIELNKDEQENILKQAIDIGD